MPPVFDGWGVVSWGWYVPGGEDSPWFVGGAVVGSVPGNMLGIHCSFAEVNHETDWTFQTCEGSLGQFGPGPWAGEAEAWIFQADYFLSVGRQVIGFGGTVLLVGVASVAACCVGVPVMSWHVLQRSVKAAWERLLNRLCRWGLD